MLKINIFNQYDHSLIPYRRTIRKVLKKAYHELGFRGKSIINVILLSNEDIQILNRDYRQKDVPTDVISFENDDSIEELGDIFISIEKAIEQATNYGHSFIRELGFLTVHGFLHCNGYDHLTEEDEKIMFKLQEDILEKCKITR
jgi:probable rRNA maturation factor